MADSAKSGVPSPHQKNPEVPPPYSNVSDPSSPANGTDQSQASQQEVSLTAAFENLKLSAVRKEPDVDTCLAHLKLLFAIQSMKEDVGYNDGLWNIWDARADEDADLLELESLMVEEPPLPDMKVHDRKLHALSKLREKRWALFVARAVDRYEAWWESLPRTSPLSEGDMVEPNSPKYERFPDQSPGSFPWRAEMLPPLDVLMVWHAHMLNPRAFLEDCMLSGLAGFWAAGIPWTLVNDAINTGFDYKVSADCKAVWTAQTGRKWNNSDDPMTKAMRCPACNISLEIPWTTCGVDEGYKGPLTPGLTGEGYGDGKFLYTCSGCGIALNKELLSVAKFRKDTENLLMKSRPMPGTVLDHRAGTPQLMPPAGAAKVLFARTFPNRMIQKVLRIKVFELIRPGLTSTPTMATVRDLIEKVLASKQAVCIIEGFDRTSAAAWRYRLSQTARISIRKMMGRYWENFSPFALDLCGAVVRQGAFIEKMVKIDWLHSPSAAKTMSRLLEKYRRFFAIMAAHPNKVAVPTLDVDLAWHTHQLSPRAYYEFSVDKTARFIDHDDKIDEHKLSESFEWTSKVYQDMYGEVYSECTCWYCETIRASHVSSVGSALGLSKQGKVAESFYASGAASLCPPDQSAHISSHNAVRSVEDPIARLLGGPRGRVQAQLAALHQRRLDEAYAKAQRRAQKKGRTLPPRDQYYDHWGYPYYLYGPYMYPLWLTPAMYYGWAPGYVAACGAGGWAACAAGSCGGGVAAGACGGPGGCGGAGAGGCSGGGCGGGGCGGGGGGCGGGGGGGCGGGGGS